MVIPVTESKQSASPAGSGPPTKREVPCPVCDSRRYMVKWKPWNAITDPRRLYGAASGLPGTQQIVECLDCGMIYENPRYADETIVEGYTSAENEGHDSQYPMRVASFERALRRLAPKLPAPGARVLDVGCAGGAFVEAAKRCGYDVVGLEPSRELVQAARARGLDVVGGTLEAHAFAPRSFDMITFWDVLEHVPDPKELLHIARSLLRPGGTLLVNFPDIGTLPAKITGKRFWWVISVHLHHFTRGTTEQLCRRTGFEPFHVQRYWQTLELGYLEDIAVHLKVPLSGALRRVTPGAMKKLPIPYWASQTTLLARAR